MRSPRPLSVLALTLPLLIGCNESRKRPPAQVAAAAEESPAGAPAPAAAPPEEDLGPVTMPLVVPGDPAAVEPDSPLVPFVPAVEVKNDSAHLRVELTARGGWELRRSDLSVVLEPGMLPVDAAGLASPADFPWRQEHEPGTTSASYALAVDELAASLGVASIPPGSKLTVAVHAVLQSGDQVADVWAGDLAWPGDERARTFVYTTQAASPEVLAASRREAAVRERMQAQRPERTEQPARVEAPREQPPQPVLEQPLASMQPSSVRERPQPKDKAPAPVESEQPVEQPVSQPTPTQPSKPVRERPQPKDKAPAPSEQPAPMPTPTETPPAPTPKDNPPAPTPKDNPNPTPKDKPDPAPKPPVPPPAPSPTPTPAPAPKPDKPDRMPNTPGDAAVVTTQVVTINGITTGDFRTQTQGGWGTTASGSNPGAYRDANFAAAFPNGALIGNAGGYTATFSSSAAVASFLPAGGTAAPLAMNHVDPLTTEAGVLAGQVLALTLSVGFDAADPNFSASATPLANLVVADPASPCLNMTVRQVLDAANAVLAGMPSTLTPSQASDCVARINENFVDGTHLGAYLRAP